MNFISIRLKSVSSGIKSPFDAYLKIAERHIHYLHKNDEFDQDHLEQLRSRGVKKLYIKEEEEPAYQNFLNQMIENIHLTETDTKASIAMDIGENSASEVMHNPVLEKTYQLAMSSSDILQKILKEDNAVLREMLKSNTDEGMTLANRLQKYLLNTATIAIKFAEAANLNINSTHLGVAAFYHDISFVQYSESEQKLFFKDIKEMSPEELSSYKAHPEKSAALLQDKSFAEKDVLELIIAHEEKISGQGFPKKLTKLTTGQEVLSLVAFYNREVLCLGKDPSEFEKNMMIDQLGNYSLELLKQFKSFLKNYL